MKVIEKITLIIYANIILVMAVIACLLVFVAIWDMERKNKKKKER